MENVGDPVSISADRVLNHLMGTVMVQTDETESAMLESPPEIGSEQGNTYPVQMDRSPSVSSMYTQWAKRSSTLKSTNVEKLSGGVE